MVVFMLTSATKRLIEVDGCLVDGQVGVQQRHLAVEQRLLSRQHFKVCGGAELQQVLVVFHGLLQLLHLQGYVLAHLLRFFHPQ